MVSFFQSFFLLTLLVKAWIHSPAGYFIDYYVYFHFSNVDSLVVVYLEANEKGLLRRLQQLPTSLLEVYISEVSIQKGKVKPFDKDGCSLTTGGPSVVRYYAVVKYIIKNSGDADFSPPLAYKG